MKNGGSTILSPFLLSEIHSRNPRSSSLQRGIAETLYLSDMAEFLSDKLAQNAVALAMKDAHFLDAEEFGFIQILVDNV